MAGGSISSNPGQTAQVASPYAQRLLGGPQRMKEDTLIGRSNAGESNGGNGEKHANTLLGNAIKGVLA